MASRSGPKPRKYDQKTPEEDDPPGPALGAVGPAPQLERVALVDSFGWEAPKTKDAIAALDALGLEGKVLVVLGRDDDDRAAARSATSPTCTTIDAGELNAYDVLDADWVLFTDATLPTSAARRRSPDA